jgi:hypothetical protein
MLYPRVECRPDGFEYCFVDEEFVVGREFGLAAEATEYSSTCHPSPFPPFAECIITDCK